MLVLTRKRSERVIIGDAIEVKVLEIRGGTVKLGFNCPQEISIRREEISPLARAGSNGKSGQFELLLASR